MVKLSPQILVIGTTALCISTSEAFSAGKSPDRSVLQQIHSKKTLSWHGHHMKKRTHGSSGELQMSEVAAGGAKGPMNIKTFVQKNSFLIGMATAVMFARAFPSVSYTKLKVASSF